MLEAEHMLICLIFMITPSNRCYCSCFTDNNTEAQRQTLPCPRSHSKLVVEPGFEISPTWLQIYALLQLLLPLDQSSSKCGLHTSSSGGSINLLGMQFLGLPQTYWRGPHICVLTSLKDSQNHYPIHGFPLDSGGLLQGDAQ